MKQKSILVGMVFVLSLGLIWLARKPSFQNNVSDQLSTQKSTSVQLISATEFAQLAKNEGVFILDVHTPEQPQIPGTDDSIAYNQIKENQSRLPDDKSTPILVYCRSGSMSELAAKDLVNLGFTDVYDLDGGTDAYKEVNASVELTPSTQSLGTVIYGEVATTTFTITNYTNKPVQITRVSTSCGCTSAKVDTEELGAYESTVVNVTFDPSVHKDDTDVGELTRTIYIQTNNPNFSELESTITATVIKKS